MKIRTKESLVDAISSDRAWRVREISELKTLMTNAQTSEIRKKVIARSGTALLYAHWEGFVKNTGTYFLEYIASQRLRVVELKSNFITLLLKAKLDQASESNKNSAFADVTEYIMNNQQTRARLPTKGIVSTDSNLSTAVLKEIVWCLGLDYGHFSTKEKLIDSKLVSRRNHIAHGDVLDIQPEDFIELADEVLGLINTFKNMLENSVMLETYKAA